MSTRTGKRSESRLRDPGRRLAGEYPSEGRPGDTSGNGKDGLAAPAIRAGRARLNLGRVSFPDRRREE